MIGSTRFLLVQNRWVNLVYLFYLMIGVFIVINILTLQSSSASWIIAILVCITLLLNLVGLWAKKPVVGFIDFNDLNVVIEKNKKRRIYSKYDVELIKYRVSGFEGSRSVVNYWEYFPNDGKANLIVLKLKGNRFRHLVYLRDSTELENFKHLCDEYFKVEQNV